MRELLVGILTLGLVALSATAHATKTYEDRDGNAEARVKPSADSPKESDRPKSSAAVAPEPSSSELEHRQLRDLVASQSAELQATREQLRQLQERMELLEKQLRAQNNSLASKEIAGTQAVLALQATELSTPTIGVLGPNHPEVGNSFLSAEASLAQPPVPAASSTAQGNNHTEGRQTDQEHPSESIQLANGKVRIGTLLYADYAYYAKSGFGPQFTSQINPPGPGNNSYNTFEITRAYINLIYSPSDAVTFRLSPDLYRQIGAAPGTKIGKVSAIGPNTDQGLPFRLKYAYVDLNTLFASSAAFKKDKLSANRGGHRLQGQ